MAATRGGSHVSKRLKRGSIERRSNNQLEVVVMLADG